MNIGSRIAESFKTADIGSLEDGQTIEGQVFLVEDRRVFKDKNNNPYTRFVLGDGSLKLEGVLWRQAENNNMAAIRVLDGLVGSYAGSLQLNIRDYEPVEIDTDSLAGEILREEYQKLKAYMDRVTDPDYRAILDLVMERYKEDFIKAPAACRIHHAYTGGLLEHSLEVTDLACRIGEGLDYINLDLVITGAILHDIGKVETLRANLFSTDLVREKYIYDHLILGVRLVESLVWEAGLDIGREKLDLLLSIIGSHHGKREWKSLMLPNTMEAWLVHYGDLISSRSNMYVEKNKEAEEGLIDVQIEGERTYMFSIDRVGEIMK